MEQKLKHLEDFSWLKTGFTEWRDNSKNWNDGFSRPLAKILKKQTYKYHQKDRFDETNPLHLMSVKIAELWS